jgi:hypothetical protein
MALPIVPLPSQGVSLGYPVPALRAEAMNTRPERARQLVAITLRVMKAVAEWVVHLPNAVLTRSVRATIAASGVESLWRKESVSKCRRVRAGVS